MHRREGGSGQRRRSLAVAIAVPRPVLEDSEHPLHAHFYAPCLLHAPPFMHRSARAVLSDGAQARELPVRGCCVG